MLKNSPAFSGFSVDDTAKAKQFYGEILGIPVEETPMGLTLKLQSMDVFVYPKDNHAPASFTILNFPVGDIDKTFDELTSRGVVFEKYDNMHQDEKGITRGKSANMGPDIAWFTDPAGNILSILQD